MKKLAILLSAVLISGSLSAQKATSDNPYSLEGIINYDATNGISWDAPELRVRYFVNDNIAARVQLGLGMGSTSDNFYENADGTGAVGTMDASASGWSLGLGAEYHLAGTDKMSPYFMAGLSFGGSSTDMSATNTDGTMYVADMSMSSDASMSSMGIALGAGMDYYVADNLYVGLELAFGWMSESDKGGSSTVTAGGTTVTTTTPESGGSSGMGIGAANAAFRIGWRF